jgi:hypothetical protein
MPVEDPDPPSVVEALNRAYRGPGLVARRARISANRMFVADTYAEIVELRRTFAAHAREKDAANVDEALRGSQVG